MNGKSFIQLGLLVLCLPLGEAYLLFHVPELRERAWFLLSDLSQDIEWYVKDSSEAIIWIVFLTVWYFRERKKSVIFSRYLGAFLLFRVSDLVMYWVNDRSATDGYIICYLLFIFSLFCIYTQSKLVMKLKE
jgi:hypothetical protein